MQAVNSDPEAVSRSFDIHSDITVMQRRRRLRYIAVGITAFACVLIATSTLTIMEPEITQEISIASSSTNVPSVVVTPIVGQINEVDAALITALKQQNQWQENRLTALAQEIETKTLLYQQAKSQLNEQESLIKDLKLSQRHLQDNIDQGQVEITQLNKQIASYQSSIDTERKMKEADKLSLESKLQETRKQAEIDKQALASKVAKLEETASQLTIALEAKSRLAAQLEDKLDAQKTNEQNSQLVQNAQKDATEKQRLQHAFAALQEKYNQEHNQLLAKEALFAQLSESVRTQKEALKSLEEARQSLTAELAAAKQQYTEHLSQIGINNKPKEFAASTSVGVPKTDAKRVHHVNKGETLSGISQKYYGSATRWNEIYEANKDLIPNKNQIKPGTDLVIP